MCRSLVLHSFIPVLFGGKSGPFGGVGGGGGVRS